MKRQQWKHFGNGTDDQITSPRLCHSVALMSDVNSEASDKKQKGSGAGQGGGWSITKFKSSGCTACWRQQSCPHQTISAVWFWLFLLEGNLEVGIFVSDPIPLNTHTLSCCASPLSRLLVLAAENPDGYKMCFPERKKRKSLWGAWPKLLTGTLSFWSFLQNGGTFSEFPTLQWFQFLFQQNVKDWDLCSEILLTPEQYIGWGHRSVQAEVCACLLTPQKLPLSLSTHGGLVPAPLPPPPPAPWMPESGWLKSLYQVAQNSAHSWPCASRFSTPDGKWRSPSAVGWIRGCKTWGCGGLTAYLLKKLCV